MNRQAALARAEKSVYDAEQNLLQAFANTDRIAFNNQKKVLEAFQKERVALRHFSGTTGYGYDDTGRDTLCKLYADIFCAEDAIVSPHILSGTHALTVGLFALLRPGDVLLSVTGELYDTMQDVIKGDDIGSLKDFGIRYQTIPLKDGKIDIETVRSALQNTPKIKVVYIQRSRGYEWRDALSVREIEKIAAIVRKIRPEICVFVDNCYGEFVENCEPTQVGADLCVGSLIKNIGGGIAPTGGYLAGKKKYIELAAGRLTAPSVGMEIGSDENGYRSFYQGLFLAPHVTAQAIKGARLFSEVFTKLGYDTLPKSEADFGDIICSIRFETEKQLTDFCQTIQMCSPIDSFAIPTPWSMPGYEHQVIMAAGCFVQGASIELSADSPIKKPYIAYVQGGLTYEHVKIAVTECAAKILTEGDEI